MLLILCGVVVFNFVVYPVNPVVNAAVLGMFYAHYAAGSVYYTVFSVLIQLFL